MRNLAVLVTTLFAVAAHAAQDPPGVPRRVDLVIALDTSNSMDGLIDSARSRLWDVVDVLAHAKPAPVLRVGLLSYGNDGYDAHKGWVRKDADLTTDLDKINELLFKLSTNGGQEYVARAVHVATTQMAWDQDPTTLKMIFVAGNEPATQDPQIPLERAVGDARARSIFVNAVYCGSDGSWDATGWRQVASLGNGKYAAIDQNRRVAVATPVDAQLDALSAQLNDTYVPYGATGAAHAANQAAQDANARAAGASVAAGRAAVKSSVVYRNSDWDLVDAHAAGKPVATVPTAALPPPMQAMRPAEREQYVAEKAKQRAELKRRIDALSRTRDAWLAKHKAATPQPAALDDALAPAIKSEATAKGFAF